MAVLERHPMTKRQMGARLRELRTASGLSQDVVATALRISQRTYSSWEIGRTSPGLEMIDVIAHALGCEPDELSHPPTGPLFKIKRGRPENPADD